MSNSVGQSLFRQSLLYPTALENKSKVNSPAILSNNLYQGVSAHQSVVHNFKALSNSKFLGNGLKLRKTRLPRGSYQYFQVTPHAVLSMDPASEVI